MTCQQGLIDRHLQSRFTVIFSSFLLIRHRIGQRVSTKVATSNEQGISAPLYPAASFDMYAPQHVHVQ